MSQGEEIRNVALANEERIPPALAFFLTKLAELVAAQLAAKISEAVAGEFIRFVFGHLATKADLQAAVQEILTHIDLRMDGLALQLLEGPLYAAEIHLSDYRGNKGEPSHLRAALAKSVDATGMMQSKIGQDSTFRRTGFGVIMRLVAVDVTIRVAVAAVDQKETGNLAAACARWAQVIEDCISTTEDFEQKLLIDHGIESWDESDGIGQGPTLRRWFKVFQGAASLRSRRFGTETRTTGVGRGYSKILADHNAIKTALSDKAEAEKRQRIDNLYTPARKLISELRRTSENQLLKIEAEGEMEP